MKSMHFKKQFSPPKKYRKKQNKFWEKQFWKYLGEEKKYRNTKQT